jgi:hypothetical protein
VVAPVFSAVRRTYQQQFITGGVMIPYLEYSLFFIDEPGKTSYNYPEKEWAFARD